MRRPPQIVVVAAALELVLVAVSLTARSTASIPALVPLPVRVTPAAGAFTLRATTVIAAEKPFARLGRELASMLDPATGFDFEVKIGRPPSKDFIAIRQNPSLAAPLGSEGYRLTVTPKGATIEAAAAAGAFYGMQTLRQLLPVEIYREAPVADTIWAIPAVSIEDMPRFSWRGSHLDVARHFMPKEYVKKHLDLMAMHKLNRFHWHLTDDQGWRVEIKQYPKLTEVGGWRPETLIGHEPSEAQIANAKFDGKRYGGFYTQDDIREIVAYAAERFITIVPEIEMPGHSQEVVAAYPERGSADDRVEPRTHWGVSKYLLNADDATIAFMQNVLGEVMQLFPSPWIHVGGDEAVKDQWKANPKIQARMAEVGAKTEDELQSWFIRQMDAYLTKHGRRLIGWDEILQGGLAENATVMSWQGVNGAIAAARAGHDAVLTPSSETYLDHYQSRDTAHEPLAIGGFLPLDRVYNWEPIPPALEAQYQSHILGVQAQLWTEYMPDPKQVEYMAFPRLSALAEVAWTPAARRNFDDFRARLDTHLERLKILDVNFRPVDKSGEVVK